ncbi:MAG: dTDP-4-dehydrorhamnose reductase [Anaerolineae bacterium]|nr:dTDP-4-dehydrorhamnose reductase [Anaerolineae bacterium]
MRIVITGGNGQLGQALARVLCAQHDIVSLDLPEYDITRRDDIARLVNHHPDLVIHCAAMTDVDGCARDPIAAFRVNALGTHNVALACQRANAAMLYISTNEVFDGTRDTPYLEWDEPRAINPYGASKLAGERMVQMLLTRFYIVRTAWLYAPGRNNFVAKVLARAQAQRALAYVDDELGNPTYAPDLARAIAALIETEHYGIYHLVNEGIASRYDWAARILQHAGRNDVTLTRTKLAEFKRDSTPPRNGALTNFIAAHTLGIRLRAWQDALAEYFNEPMCQ